MSISQPSTGISVKRGERVAEAKKYRFKRHQKICDHYYSKDTHCRIKVIQAFLYFSPPT